MMSDFDALQVHMESVRADVKERLSERLRIVYPLYMEHLRTLVTETKGRRREDCLSEWLRGCPQVWSQDLVDGIDVALAYALREQGFTTVTAMTGKLTVGW